MKTRNLFFSLLISGLGIGLFSCNFGNNGNVTNFPPYPVVAIDYSQDFSGVIFGTYWGYCIAPTTDFYPGDCTAMGFSIDYDNQPPNADYPTASNIVWGDAINQKPLEQTYDSVRINDYTLPISDVVCVSSPYYKGKVFFGITCKDNSPNYRLVYNSQESDSADVKNLYLLAQPSSSSSLDVPKNYAFDLSYLIQNNGITDTDGTITGFVNAKYIKANLKYFTGISINGTPNYSTAINSDQTGSQFIFFILQ